MPEVAWPRTLASPRALSRAATASPSAATIRAAIGASNQRALDALKVLDMAGVVRKISEGGYDRQFAADELFALIEANDGRVATVA